MATRVLGNYICRLATIADKGAMVPVLARSFLNEPIHLFTDTTFKESEEMSDLILEESLPEGHTYILEDAKGKVMSFTMCVDFSKQLEDNHPILQFVDSHRHFSITGELEYYAEKRYAERIGFPREKFPMGNTMYILMGGTDPEFQNRGFSTHTLESLIPHCQEQKYRHLMGLSTSLFTRKLSKSHGMVSIEAYRFDEWFPKGSIYIRGTEIGHDALHVMVLDLNKYANFNRN